MSMVRSTIRVVRHAVDLCSGRAGEPVEITVRDGYCSRPPLAPVGLLTTAVIFG
ncbi:MAG: hypothetical protein JWR32_4190 [Mycobacterium sp.]|nr:hypothetical protein [Mycobacterium sp.]